MERTKEEWEERERMQSLLEVRERKEEAGNAVERMKE